jgi:hypothetical protein
MEPHRLIQGGSMALHPLVMEPLMEVVRDKIRHISFVLWRWLWHFTNLLWYPLRIRNSIRHASRTLALWNLSRSPLLWGCARSIRRPNESLSRIAGRSARRAAGYDQYSIWNDNNRSIIYNSTQSMSALHALFYDMCCKRFEIKYSKKYMNAAMSSVSVKPSCRASMEATIDSATVSSDR